MVYLLHGQRGPKFHAEYHDVHEIIKVENNNNVLLKNLEGKIKRVHMNELKRAHELPEEILNNLFDYENPNDVDDTLNDTQNE